MTKADQTATMTSAIARRRASRPAGAMTGRRYPETLTHDADADCESTATSGSPAIHYKPASRAVFVDFNMPDASRVTGRLLGAMYMRGELHHYRVSLGQGVMLIAPPAWLDRDSRCMVLLAGLPVPEAMLDDGAAVWMPVLVKANVQVAS